MSLLAKHHAHLATQMTGTTVVAIGPRANPQHVELSLSDPVVQQLIRRYLDACSDVTSAFLQEEHDRLMRTVAVLMHGIGVHATQTRLLTETRHSPLSFDDLDALLVIRFGRPATRT